MEAALDVERGKVISWPSKLLPPLHSKLFKDCQAIVRLVTKGSESRMA